MKMYVLGAGASHGASHYGDVRPPLVEGFFPAASDVGLFDYEEFEEWRGEIEENHDVDIDQLAHRMGLAGLEHHFFLLERFVSEQMGVEPAEYADATVNIERLMGLVEGEILGRHGLVRWREGRPPMLGAGEALEAQLYLLICGTLIGSSRDAECDYHETIAASLDAGDLVVSFNYDLLADRALRNRDDWFQNDGYGIEFHRVGTHADIDGNWQAPQRTESQIELLKLHGSLNWLHPRSTAEVFAHLDLHNQDVPEPENVLYCLDDMNPRFEDDGPVFEWWGRYEHWEGETAFDLYSLIVPPSISKQYREWENYLGPLWTRALVAGIRDVTEIIFIGYSLRPEDLRSWWLFKKIASQGMQLRTVRVVDPNDDTVQRFRNVFGDDRVEWTANSIEEYAHLIR